MTEEKSNNTKQGRQARRGGRGRKRHTLHRRNKPPTAPPASSSKKVSTPPAPQVKITIRNIQNSAKYGSVKSILKDLVPKLLNKCTETKANNQYDFDLDRSAIRRLLDEEEKVIEYKAKEKERLERERRSNISESSGDEKEENNTGTAEEKANQEPGKSNEPTTQEQDDLTVLLAPKTASSLPTVTLSPLYIIPARKTRRRGERAGTAYILLVSPSIEAPKPLTKCVKNHSGSDMIAESDEKSGKDVNKPIPPVNHARQLARNRLLLANALEALQSVAADDLKTQDLFSGCIVEPSPNVRSWKNQATRPDRREGTIEATADYKQWLKSVGQHREELKARPKPAPGGGVLLSGTGVEGQDSGEPIAVLVQHLREKNLENKRKRHTKKKDDSKRKPKKETERKKSRLGSGNGGTAKKEAGDSKKRKKKKAPPRVRKGTATAPIAVLKSPGAPT